MFSLLLMFLLPAVTVQRASPGPSCPASCVVCSQDAVICQRLAHFIRTGRLVVVNGTMSSAVYQNMLKPSVQDLKLESTWVLQEDNDPKHKPKAADSTQALLLTEGSISTVQPASLSNLTNITVLGLSDNQISELDQGAFRKLPLLQTLLLDHNFLTSQTLQGGALTNLTQLEVLALGHNLINMVQAGWFKGTKALLSLKLEGNLLTSLDSGSFPLNEFRDLESLDLSDNLIQHLDRYSFRGLVSLKTLDLSRNRLSSASAEAFSYLNWLTNLNLDMNLWNCSCELVDLAAVLSSFIQQPDKTLYNGRRMVCVNTNNPAVTTVLELTEANCVASNQNITLQIKTRDSVMPQVYAQNLAIAAVICFIGGVGLTLLVVLIYHQVSQRRDTKESQSLKEEEEEEKSSPVANHVNHLDVRERTRDSRLYNGELWSKEGKMLDGKTDRHVGRFQCPHCKSDGQIPLRKDNWMNGGIRGEKDNERRRVRMMTEEERSRTAFQQPNSSRDVRNQFYSHNTSSSSHPLREMTETWPSLKSDRAVDNYRTDVEANIRSHDTLHRTFKPPEQDQVQGLNSRGWNGQFGTVKNTELKRETRNVTFDLQSLRTRQGEESLEDEAATPRDKKKDREHRHKAQSSRSLWVKLHLNPHRKSKVHPGRKNELQENRSPRRRRQKKHHGKEGEEEGGEEKYDKKTKSSREKRTKSSKSGREGKTKKGQKGGGGRKSKDAKMQKASSKSEKEGQQSSEGNQEENLNPESSRPAEGTTAADQSAVSQQAVHYQAAGLVRGSAQPFAFVSVDRNRTTNLSLLGSQLTGSNLSLQGGSALLNTFTSGSNPRLPGGFPPGVGLSGLSVAPGGSSESFSRPAAGGIMSSVPALLTNTGLAASLQAAPLQTPQELTLSLANLAANPTLLSQLPSESSALGTSLRPEPKPGQGFQTGEGLLQLIPKSQDSVPDMGQDGSGATPQAPGLETTVDMSKSNSQTESSAIPAGPTISLPPGGAPLTEGPVVGGSVDVDVSSQSESIVEAGAAALLQQEYLSEEGDSSPRRRLKLIIPEKTSSRPPTALERKIR